MNIELVQKAHEKVGSPNTLINLVSRRVRQLNSGNRPMILVSPTTGVADIALMEIIEGKLGWELPVYDQAVQAAAAKRKTKGN